VNLQQSREYENEFAKIADVVGKNRREMFHLLEYVKQQIVPPREVDLTPERLAIEKLEGEMAKMKRQLEDDRRGNALRDACRKWQKSTSPKVTQPDEMARPVRTTMVTIDNDSQTMQFEPLVACSGAANVVMHDLLIWDGPVALGGGVNGDDLVDIRPVGIESRSNAHPTSHSGLSPLHQLLTKNLQIPTFSNEKRDWDEFVYNFEEFLSKMEGKGPIDEKAKLEVLELAMPSPIKDEIKLLKKKKPQQLVFSEMMQILEERFGEGRGMSMRRKWQEISLVNHGKIQMTQFKDFETKFKLGELEIKDVTPHESYRMLISKLPSFMLTWVVEEEQKLLESRPTLSFTGVVGLTVEGSVHNIERMVGAPPQRNHPHARWNVSGGICRFHSCRKVVELQWPCNCGNGTESSGSEN
jgi:hypothetical protein